MIQNNDFQIIFLVKKQFFYKINVYTDNVNFFNDDENKRKSKNKF